MSEDTKAKKDGAFSDQFPEVMRFPGRLIEAGDSHLGVPTVVFEASRQALAECPQLPLYEEVQVIVVKVGPPKPERCFELVVDSQVEALAAYLARKWWDERKISANWTADDERRLAVLIQNQVNWAKNA